MLDQPETGHIPVAHVRQHENDALPGGDGLVHHVDPVEVEAGHNILLVQGRKPEGLLPVAGVGAQPRTDQVGQLRLGHQRAHHTAQVSAQLPGPPAVTAQSHVRCAPEEPVRGALGHGPDQSPPGSEAQVDSPVADAVEGTHDAAA